MKKNKTHYSVDTRPSRLRFYREIMIALLVGIVISVLFHFHVFDKLEFILVDMRYRLRQNPHLNDNLAIIGITKECIDEIGGYPIPRNLYADLVDTLNKAGAKSVCFDVFFDLPGNNSDNDQSLSQSFLAANMVTLPIFTPQKIDIRKKLGNMIAADQMRKNLTLFTESVKHEGHINAIPDSDGKIRRIPFMLFNDNAVYYPMAFEAYLQHKGIKREEILYTGNKLMVRDISIPLDVNNCFSINYFNPETAITFHHSDLPDFSSHGIQFYAFSDVVKQRIPAKNFSNKIVLIGQTSLGLTNADECVTPFEIMFGLFLQGSLINSFLNADFIHRPSQYISIWLIVLFSFLLSLLITRLNFIRTTLVCVLSILFISMSGIFLFNKFGFLLQIVPLCFVVIIHFSYSLIRKLNEAFGAILKRDTELGIINKVGENIRDITEISDTPNIITENLFEAIEVEACLLYIKQNETDEQQMMRKAERIKDGVEPALKIELIDFLEQFEQALKTAKKPIIINDVDTAHNSHGFIQQAYETIHSILIIPLIVHQETIGIICLCNRVNSITKRYDTFSQEDLSLLRYLVSQSSVSIDNYLLYNNLHEFFLNTIQSLVASIDAKDQYTAGHSQRVTEISEAIGFEMGMDPQHLENLKISATLHDVGKIGISDSILCSDKRLTDEEFTIIKSHPSKGEDILKHIKEFINIIPGVKHHHERYDGRGYPDGLKGEEIPLNARIIAIADTFDAMTSNRTYRKKLDLNHTLNEIRNCAGSQFDPEVVKYFFKVYEKYASNNDGPFAHLKDYMTEIKSEETVQANDTPFSP